jgi:tripartite-type tricarboxylate transporter receptor subunit TctC
LGVCSEERVAALPDVPTMKELGYDVVLPAWMVLFAYKGVPEENIKFLGEKFTEALNTVSAKALANKANVVLTPNTGEQLEHLYNQTIKNLKDILASVEK